MSQEGLSAQYLITQSDDVKRICDEFAAAPYVTIDTEFLREKTYYPKLCLIQICAPDMPAYAIDPLVEGIDLTPLKDLFANEKITKVVHAGRQDLEIFYHLFQTIPAPLFDSQIAASVCGYGDSVGYQTLVEDICGASLDKAHQFTNWEHRPLTEKQLQYALDDVIYLRDIYVALTQRLTDNNRTSWLEDEEAILLTPQTYQIDASKSWEKLKLKNTKPRTLALAQALAKWREEEAAKRNIPKTWLLKDDTIADLAQRGAKTAKDLEQIRSFPTHRKDAFLNKVVLEIIQKTPSDIGKHLAASLTSQDKAHHIRKDSEHAAVFEMMKMLLKIKAAQHSVSPRIIASQDDLKMLAVEENPRIKALTGWRHDIFGRDAMDLKKGKIGLSLEKGKIVISAIQ